MKKILYLFVAITTFACNTTTKKDEKKNDVANLPDQRIINF